jgi:hypothetical protein
MVEDPTSPAISGRVSSPAAIGEKPRPIWKYWPRNTELPNITTPATMLPSTDISTVRSRNSHIGTTGSGTLVSTRTATANASTPSPTMTPDVADSQSNCLPASEIQTSRVETPPTISVAPQ